MQTVVMLPITKTIINACHYVYTCTPCGMKSNMRIQLYLSQWRFVKCNKNSLHLIPFCSLVPFNVAFLSTFIAYSVPASWSVIFLTRNTWKHKQSHKNMHNFSWLPCLSNLASVLSKSISKLLPLEMKQFINVRDTQNHKHTRESTS